MIDSLVFQFYQNYEGEAGVLEALRTQKVFGLGFLPSALKDKIPGKNIQLATLPLPQFTALFFNLNDTPALADKNVRQALALSINKPKVLRDTLGSDGMVIDGPVLSGFPGFKSPQSDIGAPEEAVALLDKKWPQVKAEDYRKKLISNYIVEHATTTVSTSTLEVEAGKIFDAQLPAAQLFYRLGKDGNAITLRLVTADTAEYRQAAALIAGYWQDAGIKTEISFVDQKEMANKILKERDYDVLLYGVIVGNDPDQYLFWHSSQVYYPGLNFSGYTNPKVDNILERIRGTANDAALPDLYAQMEVLLANDVPAVFLYSPLYTYALGNQVKGFAVEKIAHPADRFANVTDWYIKVGKKWKF